MNEKKNEDLSEVSVLRINEDGSMRIDLLYFDWNDDTDWKIDVWNCRGVLKMTEWGMGYGSIPELNCEWIDTGYFKIPVKKGTEVTKEQKKAIENLLLQILEFNGGAINKSGFYKVPWGIIEAIDNILNEGLYMGDD